MVMRQQGETVDLAFEQRPDPVPGFGEAIVRVEAVAVNRLDWLVRDGLGHAYTVRLPLIPGYDVAGEVVGVGAGDDAVREGDRVYVHYDYSCGRCQACLEGEDSLCSSYGLMGVDHDGGYAELVVAPVRNLFALGEHTRFEDAAAAGSVYLTAYHMLFSRAGLRAGETVLVSAAGSGVGGAAAQLAKWAGARVIATAGGPAKCERALAGGADHAVDYSTPGWSDEVLRLTGGAGADCAIDHTGAETFAEVLRCLGPRGRVVICGATSGSQVTLDLIDLFARQISVIGSSDGTRRELAEVLSLLDSGIIAPVIDSVLPLGQAADGQRRLAERDHFGRILLAPGNIG
jgi:NADPH:quinone reductase-like Zn-dependent oxidoreductase